MDDVIYTLATAFSTDDLTAMLKGMCKESKNDVAMRMIASALCISWMDRGSIEKVLDMIDHELGD